MVIWGAVWNICCLGGFKPGFQDSAQEVVIGAIWGGFKPGFQGTAQEVLIQAVWGPCWQLDQIAVDFSSTARIPGYCPGGGNQGDLEP